MDRIICDHKEECRSYGPKCKNCKWNRFKTIQDYFEPKPKKYEKYFE